MCKWGTSKKITVIRRNNPLVPDGKHEKYVDACIADEVQMLNNKGVITIGCCCGHGKGSPIALIAKESESLCRELGYSVTHQNEAERIMKIALKGDNYLKEREK